MNVSDLKPVSKKGNTMMNAVWKLLAVALLVVVAFVAGVAAERTCPVVKRFATSPGEGCCAAKEEICACRCCECCKCKDCKCKCCNKGK